MRFLVFLLCLVPLRATAGTFSPPQDVAALAVSETVPTAFAPTAFRADDFRLEWTGQQQGVSAGLIESSVQWVRINDFLAVPRALLQIAVEDVQSGSVEYAGRTEALKVERARGVASLSVALLSNHDNVVTLHILRAGHWSEARVGFRFHPHREVDRLLLDVSCWRRGLQVTSLKAPTDEWFYVGCRGIQTQTANGLTGHLELLVYADNVPSITANGSVANAMAPNIWAFRLTHENSNVEIEGGSADLRISADLPETIHRGSFAIGVGPYSFNFQSPGDQFNSVTAVGTAYGSYQFVESIRAVFFGAFTASPQNYSDMGLYMEFESFRGLDNRLSFSLLLGAHALLYRSGDQLNGRIDPPQGFEFTLSDVFQRSANLTAGGFIQPAISGKSYYNTWLRWGPPSYFIEANYIYWTEQTSQTFLAREIGITFGVPVFRFL